MKAIVLGLTLLGVGFNPAFADTKTVGNWRVVTTADQSLNAQSIVATVQDASATFGLSFQCVAKALTVGLVPTNIENVLPDVNLYALKIRLDHNPIVPAKGEPSQNGALIIDEAAPLFPGFLAASQFTIGIQSPDGGQISLNFQPKMTSAAFADFLKSCPAS